MSSSSHDGEVKVESVEEPTVCSEHCHTCAKEFFLPSGPFNLCDNPAHPFNIFPPLIPYGHLRQPALSRDEHQNIRTFISDAELALTRYKNEISRIDMLQARIRLEEARLPAEVLSLIFSFVCHVGFWDSDRFDLKRRTLIGFVSGEPFTIAATCRYWRDVALATPKLWSNIMLVAADNLSTSDDDEGEAGDSDLDDESDQSSATMCSQRNTQPKQSRHEYTLALAIERSAPQPSRRNQNPPQPYPLNVWIHYSAGTYWPWCFSDILLTASSRIQHLHLTGSTDPFRFTFFPDPSGAGHLPARFLNRHLLNLTALDIDAADPERGDSPLHYRWLPHAKNLRTLLLRSANEIPDTAPFWSDISTQTITSLIIDDIDMKNAASIFSIFPEAALSCLSLEQNIIVELNIEPCQSSIHHLDLTIQSPHGYFCVPPYNCTCPTQCLWNRLETLTLPNLQSLRIQCSSTATAVWSPHHFSSFALRANVSQQLTSFSLHNVSGLCDWEVLQLLQMMPALTSLTVSESKGTAVGSKSSPILSTLMLTCLRAFPVIPNLAFLDVQIRDNVEAVDALVNLVKARMLQQVVVRVRAGDTGKEEEEEGEEETEEGEAIDSVQRLRNTLKTLVRTKYTVCLLSERISVSSYRDWIGTVAMI
ncbi:hypothetical protein C8J56DRAFT_973830 [Mycena floridula]|nr:hypothetical protein C8J56DRAFT_973830 [Mycena floridula]